MDMIQFLHPERIHLIWLVLIILAVLIYLSIRHQDRLKAFLSAEMQRRLVIQASRHRFVIRFICIGVFLTFCVISLMRPQIVQTETIPLSRQTANIYVVLDVSKSMMAADVAPNRLERAKAEIRDMLPYFAQHRVGLIAFAGRPTVMSPLTADQGFFRLVLDSASPQSVTLGGTRIGDALQKAVAVLKDQEGPKAILLISDGEDHESYPQEAADLARQAGIAIISVGFGSETGSTIDVADPVSGALKRVKDSNGMDVVSRLDGETLRQIALKTNGVYIPAGTGVLDLEGILKKHIIPIVEDSGQVITRQNKVELFPWFILVAMIALLGYAVAETRK